MKIGTTIKKYAKQRLRNWKNIYINKRKKKLGVGASSLYFWWCRQNLVIPATSNYLVLLILVGCIIHQKSRFLRLANHEKREEMESGPFLCVRQSKYSIANGVKVSYGKYNTSLFAIFPWLIFSPIRSYVSQPVSRSTQHFIQWCRTCELSVFKIY